MADSKTAKARLRLKTIATGIGADDLTLEAARIYLGCRRSDEAWAEAAALQAGAPVINIGSASLGFSGSSNPLVVECLMTVPLGAEAAQTWTNVDNLVTALRAAWLNAANYPSGEVKAQLCDYEPYTHELRGDLTIVRVNLLVAFENPDA